MSVNLILVVSIGLVSYVSFTNRELLNKLIFSPYTIIREKEWYRFITSAWIHADFTHLFFNLFVLYSFGNLLESVFVNWFGQSGLIFYLLLFIGSVIVAHITSYFRHKDDYHYAALGASGGVSGVLFAAILLQPLDPLYLFAVIKIPGIIFGVLYLVYSKYMSNKGQDNIGHDAHIWGAIGGMSILAVLKPQVLSSFVEQITSVF